MYRPPYPCATAPPCIQLQTDNPLTGRTLNFVFRTAHRSRHALPVTQQPNQPNKQTNVTQSIKTFTCPRNPHTNHQPPFSCEPLHLPVRLYTLRNRTLWTGRDISVRNSGSAVRAVLRATRKHKHTETQAGFKGTRFRMQAPGS